MRAWEARSFGLDGLALAERESPACGPGEVKVRVRACSLNFRDLLMVEGKYNPRQPLPLVPLSDGAGEVVEVGAGVSGLAPGDRVAALFAPDWQAGPPTKERIRAPLGGPRDGMLREEVVLPADAWRKVPDHLDFAEAATLPCAALTAWSALVENGGLTAGETVLILGTGGVSIFALQIAKLMGAVPIVTSSSDEKLERARALGAAHTVNYRDKPDWDREVFALTDKRGVDHVVEVGGPGTFNRSVRATRIGGQVHLIGVLAEGDEAPNLTSVFMKQVRVQGVFVGNGDGFERMTAAFAAAELRPAVHDRIPFAEAPAAFARLAEAQHLGKLVITL